jgi:transposase InsO family protein
MECLGLDAQDIHYLTHDQLGSMQLLIEEGVISWAQIEKYYKCGRKSVKDIFRQHEIQVPKVSAGRPVLSVSDEIVDLILGTRTRFKIGYKRTYQTVAKAIEDRAKEGGAEVKVSPVMVRKAFKIHELFLHVGPQKPPKPHPARFAARYAGQHWHTDLHYWTEPKTNTRSYLIAFLDDLTRMILHYEILEDKTMVSTAAALRRALGLKDVVIPYQITIDNGGEFTGADFQAVLAEFGIEDWRTKPYTPQQNGKIERWWGTLEKGIIDRETVEEFIKNYNNVWWHNGILEQTGLDVTPAQFWNLSTKWAPGLNPAYDNYIPGSWRPLTKRTVKRMQKIPTLAQRVVPAPIE